MFITEDFFTQANTLKLGLCSVQIAKELLHFHKPTFIGLDLRCGLYFKESQSVTRVSESVACPDLLIKSVIHFNKLSF